MKWIKSEISKILPRVTIVTLITTIVYVIICNFVNNQFETHKNIEVWMLSSQYLALFYVLIAVVSTCWIMVYEKSDNYLAYVFPRINMKKYIFAKGLITVTAAFLVIFMVSFLSLLIVLYVFPEVSYSTIVSEEEIMSSYYKGTLLVKNPLLYGFLLSAWRGILAALYAMMGFLLALFDKNIYVVLLTPFLFDLLSSYIVDVLGYPQYDVLTCFDPSRLASSKISCYTFLIPAMGMMAVNILIFIWGKVKERVTNGMLGR